MGPIRSGKARQNKPGEYILPEMADRGDSPNKIPKSLDYVSNIM